MLDRTSMSAGIVWKCAAGVNQESGGNMAGVFVTLDD
jgi:hypothetical protein